MKPGKGEKNYNGKISEQWLPWVGVGMGKEQRELSGTMLIFCILTHLQYAAIYICPKKKKKESKFEL